MAATPVPDPPFGAPVRRLNLRRPTDTLPEPRMHDLEASTATGRVDGWTVYTQRGGQGGQPVLRVRIDAPDGRVLLVAASGSNDSTTSRGPTSTLFGGKFGRVFVKDWSPAQEVEALAAVSAAFEVSWDIAASDSPSAPLAYQHARVQAQTALMSRAEFDRWWQQWHIALSDREVTMTSLATLHHAGFDPVHAYRFVVNPENELRDPYNGHIELSGTAKDVQGFSAVKAKAVAAFANSGRWSFRQVRELGILMGLPSNNTPAAGWSSFEPSMATLAFQAGLGAAEAARLLRQGRLDEETLQAMAALRSGAEDLTVY